jgi:hypothetical protein
MKDYAWFFWLLGGLVVAWFLLGGPAKARESGRSSVPIFGSIRETIWSGRSSSTTSVRSTGTRTRIPQKNETPEEQRKRIARELDQVEREVEDVAKAIQKLKEEQESSPLKGIVSLSRANAGQRLPEKEYLTVTISRSAPSAGILVSGWKVQSMITGKSATVTQGTALAYTGRSNPSEPIIAKPGDKIVILTGRSPVGVSFRTNMCTGYFEQFQDFEPSLRRSCPSPDEDILYALQAGINDACMDYIESLRSCEMPLRGLPAGLPSECYAYISEKVNYAGCVATHRGDADFDGNEWRIYLGQSGELWKERREVIKLLDQNGKTIDAVDY